VSPEDAAVAPHAALQSQPEKNGGKYQVNSRKNGAKIQNLDIKDDIFILFTVGRDSGGLTGE